MSTTQTVYCCPQHALCDVDVPGSVGRRARAAFARFDDKSVWCGAASMGKGQAVIFDFGAAGRTVGATPKPETEGDH